MEPRHKAAVEAFEAFAEKVGMGRRSVELTWGELGSTIVTFRADIRAHRRDRSKVCLSWAERVACDDLIDSVLEPGRYGALLAEYCRAAFRKEVEKGAET